MRRARGFGFAMLAAALAATPAAVSAQPDLPASLRVRPLPVELAPDAPATVPSVELSARGGRPVWLLPAAGLVAGAIIYPALVDEECQDCTVYIPEPAVGAMLGLMGGILLEVSLRLISGDLPVSALPPSSPASSTAQPDARMLR